MESSYENADFRQKFVNYIKEYSESEPVLPMKDGHRHIEQPYTHNHKENKSEEIQPLIKK
jgi:hypothetical protein